MDTSPVPNAIFSSSPTITKLAPALTKAQAIFDAAVKDSTNPHFRSKYADLSSVIEAVRGALNSNGISFLQPVGADEWGWLIETRLMHDSGEWMAFGPMRVAIPENKKGDPQALGAAITYARRYHLSAALGITQEDDDGNSLSRGSRDTDYAHPSEPKKPKPAPRGPADPKAPLPSLVAEQEARKAVLGIMTFKLGELTKGFTKEQKGNFLEDEMGVMNFKELEGLSLQALKDRLEYLQKMPVPKAQISADEIPW